MGEDPFGKRFEALTADDRLWLRLFYSLAMEQADFERVCLFLQRRKEFAHQGESTMEETSMVVSPGARQAAWPIKVLSHTQYNAYMVVVVCLGAPGTICLECGDPVEAINLWEDPDVEGWYPVGGYAIMFKTQDRNFFYGVPFFG